MEGLSCAKSLEKIHVADCQIEDTDEVMESICNCMIENKKLAKYNIKHNNIQDKGVEKICDALTEAAHVFEVEVSEWLQEETLKKLADRLTANKPKKGKGKGKGKKKK